MESLLNKCNSMHRRSGSNKENQAPTGCNLRIYKNHSAGPIGIPFKPKNSNHINFHNGLNLLRNQANQLDHHKLTVNNGFNLNNGLNNGFNRKSNNNFYQAAKLSDENMNHLNILTSSMNSTRSNISKLQSYQSHMNQQSQINQQQINQQSQVNQLSLSTSTNSSSSQNKLSDLYKSQYSGSSSSLLSYGSSNDNSSDRRFLPPPPKQNIMYHEQRYKTELCRAYEEQKNCVYGDRCMFAHGQWELKQSISKHPKYKTQKCVAFEEGLCMFGTRCSFLHEKIGSAEEIVDSMLQLNQLNKEKFSIPSQPTIKQTVTNLDTIDEQSDFLTKAIGDIEKRTQFLSSLKSDSLFDLSTIKPEFNFHPKSFNNALGNIIRLDNINEQVEKCKLLPDLTSLLVDDHANSNTLFFNDDSLSCSSRLPIFEKISSTPLQSSTNESISSNDKMDLIDNLNSSNNSSKSNSTTKSNDTTDSTASSVGANSISCESTISINSSDLKLMDFDIDSFM